MIMQITGVRVRVRVPARKSKACSLAGGKDPEVMGERC